MIKICVFVLGVFLLNTALAGQSASMDCVKPHSGISSDGAASGVVFTNPVDECDEYELKVKITTEKDVGLFGGFGIYSYSVKDGFLSSWTEMDGWKILTKDDMLLSVNGTKDGLPKEREFVIYKGSAKAICELSGGKSFNLYAGHGALSAVRKKEVEWFLKRFKITGDYARNFWVAILLDSVKENPKMRGGLVFTQKCGR